MNVGEVVDKPRPGDGKLHVKPVGLDEVNRNVLDADTQPQAP
jgi:hypothetical protein